MGRKVIRAFVVLVVAMLIGWGALSLGEIYLHNTITFHGGNHNYNNWNMFIVFTEGKV